MSKLTNKQEAFAVKFAECGDKTAAYRHAYASENSTAKTIHEQASKVSKNPKVAARIDELLSLVKKQADKEFLYTVEWRLKKLQEVIEAGMSTYDDQQGNARRENLAVVKGSIDTMNSMLGVSDDEDDVGQSLAISFSVSPAVRNVKVVKGE